MNTHRIVTGAYDNDVGSVKVFVKNGFKTKGIVRDHVEVKGVLRSIHVLEWTCESQP